MVLFHGASLQGHFSFSCHEKVLPATLGQAGPAHIMDDILAHKTAPEIQQSDVLEGYHAKIEYTFPFADF